MGSRFFSFFVTVFLIFSTPLPAFANSYIVKEEIVYNGRIEKLTLKNGIEVFLAQDERLDGKIYVNFMSKGGEDILPHNMGAAANLALKVSSNGGIGHMKPHEVYQYIQKHGLFIKPHIYKDMHGIRMHALNAKHQEKLFQIMHQALITPPNNKSLFEKMKQEVIESYSTEYANLFNDAAKKTYGELTPLVWPLASDFKKVKIKDIEKVFRYYFNDFSNYKMVILGGFEKSKIKDLVSKYVVALPTKSSAQSNTKFQYYKKDFRKVINGHPEKLSWTIKKYFSFDFVYSTDIHIAGEIIEEAINIELYKLLWQRNGITKDFGVTLNSFSKSNQAYELNIEYEVRPELEKKTLAILDKQMSSWIKSGFDLSVLKDARKNIVARKLRNHTPESFVFQLTKAFLDKDWYAYYSSPIDAVNEYDINKVNPLFKDFMRSSVQHEWVARP